MANILDGKGLAGTLEEDLKVRIASLSMPPKLVIIQVGGLEESNRYIRRKKLFGERIGATVGHVALPAKARTEEVLEHIERLNSDPSVHGIIVQLPLPDHCDKNTIIEAVAPQKDVDGLTSLNTKALFNNLPGIVPATAKGVVTLLENTGIKIDGKHVVVVGRSTLVGKPTALALLNKNATVTICHSHTKDVPSITRTADVLVVAVGKPHLITKEYVKEGQVIVDVGINILDGKTVGDVDFENVKDLVSMISPVPGGVGPMTVLSLFENLLDSM